MRRPRVWVARRRQPPQIRGPCFAMGWLEDQPASAVASLRGQLGRSKFCRTRPAAEVTPKDVESCVQHVTVTQRIVEVTGRWDVVDGQLGEGRVSSFEGYSRARHDRTLRSRALACLRGCVCQAGLRSLSAELTTTAGALLERPAECYVIAKRDPGPRAGRSNCGAGVRADRRTAAQMIVFRGAQGVLPAMAVSRAPTRSLQPVRPDVQSEHKLQLAARQHADSTKPSLSFGTDTFSRPRKPAAHRWPGLQRSPSLGFSCPPSRLASGAIRN